MKTALLASYTKDEPLLKLARMLRRADWSLYASAGTARFLKENAIECEDVGEIVGAPILGHRVVTLAREIYAGLLATEADKPELEQMGIRWIDLVYVTLYPLEDTIASGATDTEVIEKTDIGGPTLLRAAAKGRRIVLSDATQIDDLAAHLDSLDDAYLTKLAAAAERRVADYVAISAAYWENK